MKALGGSFALACSGEAADHFAQPKGGHLVINRLVPGGMVTVIWLQSLLVADQIELGSYITIVSAGFLVMVVWFVLNGRMGRKDYDSWPTGMGLDVLAGLFFGYPFWAWKMRNWFKSEAE